MMRRFFFCTLLLFSACKARTFNGGETSADQSASRVWPDVTCEGACLALAKDGPAEQENNTKSLGANAETVLADLSGHPALGHALEALGLKDAPPNVKSRWIYESLVPLQTKPSAEGKASFLAGASHESFVEFATLAASAYQVRAAQADACTAAWKTAGGLPEAYGEVAALRNVQELCMLNADSGGGGKLRAPVEQGASVDLRILSRAEVSQIRALADEGLLSLLGARREPTSGQLVPDVPGIAEESWAEMGKIVMYPRGNRLPDLLAEWSEQYDSALRNPDRTFFVSEVGRLGRQCVHMHTFSEGNAKTCRMWMMHALARRQIPHSLMWFGESVFIGEKAWVERFVEGVNHHRRLLVRLHAQLL